MRFRFFLAFFLLSFVFFSSQARNMGSDSNFATHMPALLTAVANTDGPILEMGCGDFSTPLLHAICAVNKRFLLTTETNKNWMNLFVDLKRDWHQFRFVSSAQDWNNVGLGVRWSVVFVDHAPGERRVVDIIRLRPHVDVFVVHDTQEPGYRYEPTLSSFRYKYVYRRYGVTTTLVSDTIDVSAFFED